MTDLNASEIEAIKIKKWIWRAVIGIAIFVPLWSSWYIIPEGAVGILKTWSEAKSQVGPGLHFKVPIAQSVEPIEVRQRRNVEDLSGATKNQLPITAKVSINWTVNKASAKDLFITYGGLEQFETRILDPKLRSVAKGAIAKFPADLLIRERASAVAEIQSGMVLALEGFPVTVNSPQIENIVLPERYLNAIQAKEEARENAEKEKHKLAQQNSVAQQLVNTANAERDANKARADGEAYAIKTKAVAEADRITQIGAAEASKVKAINDALSNNPLLVEYERAKRWSGIMPTTVMGEGQNVIWSMKK